jgi:hypothetical protein
MNPNLVNAGRVHYHPTTAYLYNLQALPEWRKGRLLRTLVQAKRKLKAGASYSICGAAACARDDGLVSAEARMDVSLLMAAKIGPGRYVTEWLADQFGVTHLMFMSTTTLDQRREYRLQWIDSLIKELSE